MRHLLPCALAAAFSSAIACMPAAANTSFCEPAGNVRVVSTTDPTATLIIGSLRDKLGEMALPTETFNPSDVYQVGVARRRLIFMWSSEQRWVAATERGGRGYNNPVFAFDVSADRKSVRLVNSDVGFRSTICSTVNRLITAAR